MLTMAANHSVVKFSLATRGSIDVGMIALSVNDALGLGPLMPRYVIAGVAGSLESVVTISSAITSPFCHACIGEPLRGPIWTYSGLPRFWPGT